FMPPRAVALRVRPQNQVVLGESLMIQRGADAELRYTGSDARGLRYDVYLAGDDEVFVEPLAAVDRARYVALPANLPQRIVDLAHSWTDELTIPDAKARLIEERLRREFTYDLRSTSQGKSQPVDDFLFVSKRGHCEFFSTAMALMLRAVGIPSRNVTGFVGGTWNRFGHYYAVREGDAHSWVEAYIDSATHAGWRTFDPTPPSAAQPLEPPNGVYYYARDFVEALSQRWNTYVVGYDLRRQVRMFDDVSQRYERLRFLGPGGGGMLAIALALAAGLGYVVWKRRRRSQGDKRQADPVGRAQHAHIEAAAALYRALESALQSHGVRRSPSLPPLRHAEDLCMRRHPLADEILSLTNLYLETRFGGCALTEAVRRDFERRVHEIRESRNDRAVPA
ncbi:MAG: transglutaminase domain-containing protein, partial [Myxococcota bacterium]|nr:transglutaminase domain-containing protein [Myxococcota bacterium]